MKITRFYPVLALIITITLAVASGCSTVATSAMVTAVPAVPATTSVSTISPTTPAAANIAGVPDLVITRVWLDGLMVYYTIKNVGAGDSPQTYSSIYVDDYIPAMGGSSFVDVLKPGQEKSITFSNYQWSSNILGSETQTQVLSEGYYELPRNNNKIKVCADANNEANETVETNNSKVTLIGILWDYDLLRVSNLATWRNGNGNLPEPGSENNLNGAHFQIANANMEMTPLLETIPQQVPQGWIQGTWGYFYSLEEYGSPKIAALKIPAKLHFTSKVGLSRNASGSDGVLLKFGLKDLNDTVTWIESKKLTVPGDLQDWDINLSDYEGQKCYFVLRVEAGASAANDFVIWNQAKLLQVND